LDGQRFFVRCLLSIPVEGYDDWNIGLWTEVSKEDFERAHAVWEDAAEYPRLHFRGTIANDVAGLVGLPIALGTPVEAHVTYPAQPPRIASSSDERVAGLLKKTWSKSAFEAYAVVRGLL
jgi:hypothetical protein